MTEELAFLARAERAYLLAPPGARRSLEQIIDALTHMIASGRTFEDAEPDPAERSPT